MDFQNKFFFNFIFQKGGPWEMQLSDIADISQVFIALINIGLVIFIIRTDLKKTSDAKADEAFKNSTSIKLQGFKDFVITPNFNHLQDFFNNLLSLKQQITSAQINEELNIELNKFIKSEVSKFRVNFNDAILNVNRGLFDAIKLKIEKLSDDLITVISDGNHDLTDIELFSIHIFTPINYTKNEIIALIISYKGD
ncbi:hypothetical protein GJU43_20165 [Flavobacterium sp. LC2016-23]|uniref:hypothetical protein n=1 Tax=unclassified Flavobacterium TaxID=196869 RepID=UPI0012AF2672|nr:MULTISPECIES: hypothetical protein [unclassified Flavobacterium]MCD0465973.1 hypothetical protein [Flavobacterium sp. ENC]MRX41605.1 hypothetical protein [Flavobacterium sp. LC2016-23]